MCQCNECSRLWTAYVAVRDAQMASDGVLDGDANAAYYRWLDSYERHDSGWQPTVNEPCEAFIERLVSACRGKQTRATDRLIIVLGKKVYDLHPSGWLRFYAQPEAARLWAAQEREHNRHMARFNRRAI